MQSGQNSSRLRRRVAGTCGAFVIVAVVIGLTAFTGAQAQPTGKRDSSKQGQATAPKKLKVLMLLYGPKNDGGYNLALRAAYPAIAKKFGSSVEIVQTDNVPFSDEAGKIAQQFINSGVNVIEDHVGLADIINKVCEKNPKVVCLLEGGVGKLPANGQPYYVKFWIPAYTAGLTAGLLTKSNTVGFVAPGNFPLITTQINSYALGCKRVNPKCKVRVINTNDYFNPPKSAQATNSLVDAGADVIKGYTDDPSYCPVAEKRHVYAIPEFWDGSSGCPNWVATSTVWNYTKFFLRELADIQSPTFKIRPFFFVPSKDVFSLGKWGPKVPVSVKQQVTRMFNQLINGKLNPYVGPIRDTKGAVRIKTGQKLSDQFLYTSWNWFVDGVVAK